MNFGQVPVLGRKTIQPIRRQDRHYCPSLGWLLLATIFFLPQPRAFAAVSVTISPSSVNLPVNGTQQFTATVTGADDTSVTWTILEGSAGGTISGSGLYVTPGVVGVYHMVATSNADPSQSATATVGVPGFLQPGLMTGGPCTSTLLPDGTVLYTDNNQLAEVYNPVAMKSTPTGTMTIARCFETSTLLLNGKVLLVGGQVAGGGTTASAELYDPVSGTLTVTGSMSASRQNHTATLLPNGKVLIVGGGNCNSGCVYLTTAELYDPASGTFNSTGSMLAAHILHSATLLNNGKVLIAAGTPDGGTASLDAELYDSVSGTFAETGAMPDPREQWFTATLMQNGKVLFAGGLVGSTFVSTADLYDPSTGTFAQTGTLDLPRDLHTATLLANGQVLIAGGSSTNSQPASAELYDTTSGTFRMTGNLEEPRIFHFATALANGKVLIAGGRSGAVNLASVESYDPSTGIFSSQSVFMNVARVGQAQTRLADGRILITGGADQSNNGALSATAEIYDPATREFTLTGSLNTARQLHTATLLPNGKVLVVGGVNNPMADPASFVLVPTAELYDPVSGTFSLTGSPSVPRGEHTATLLANGKVLIAGGLALSDDNPATTSAELYDPSTGTFSAGGNMTVERAGHTATLLNSGKVLIAGGVPHLSPIGFTPISGAAGEIYDPVAGSFTAVGPVGTGGYLNFVSTCCNGSTPLFASTLLPNGQVLVGLGYLFDPVSNSFAQIPNSTNANSYSLTVLPDGKVLAADGSDFLIGLTSSIYSEFLPKEISRQMPAAYLLPTGQVLLASGSSAKEADLYVPPVASSAPVVTGISPNPVTGFADVPITIQGANFTTGSVVFDSFGPVQSTFVSSTQLNAIFPAQDLVNAGNHQIDVMNTEDPRVATFTLLVVNPQLQSTVPEGGSLNFAHVNVGSSAGLPANFTNIGNLALTLNSFSISGTDSADFSFDPATTCPAQGLTLAAQATCSATIKFTPPAVGTFNATLTVNYQLPGSPQVIPLTGIGVGVPGLSVAPPSLTFGNQAIGTSSAAQFFTITNSGTGTLQITDVASGDTADFHVNNICTVSLAPGANCSVSVTFTPASAGNIAAPVNITANDGLPHSVQVSGTGIAVPAAAIAPLSLTFAAQTIGTSSAPQGVIVASTGTAALAISSITLTDPADFQMTSNCSASLAPNTNCSFGVTFAPSTVGSISGSAIVTAGDGGSPHTVSLTGTATGFALAPAAGGTTTASITAGQPATYQLSLAAQSFSGLVNLTCAPVTAIANTICSVSPNPATPSGTAPTPVTVSVTTTARGGLPFVKYRRPFGDIGPLGFGRARLFLFLLIGLGLVAGSRRARRGSPLPLAIALLFVLLAAGCAGDGTQGGGSTGPSAGTPAGTYQIVVTASGPGLTRTVTLTLNVQ